MELLCCMCRMARQFLESVRLVFVLQLVLNPHRHRGGGVTQHPPWVFFWNGRRSAWRITLKFRLTNWAYFAQLSRKILTGSGQVTELWRHTSNNLRKIFHRNHFFSNAACCHWLEWGHYAWFRSEHDHVWPVTLHFDLRRLFEVTDLDRPHIHI